MPAASIERDQNLEQYLSRNRMNRRLQSPMKTAFSGLSRKPTSHDRRITATIDKHSNVENELREIEKIL
jgi:hypothetical protein